MSDNPFTDGQQFSSARLNSMYNAHQNNGVLTGLDASTSVNAFDVDVSSGDVFLNDSVVSAAATTVTHSTSDSEDRIDLISVNGNGTVSITQGSPAATSGEPVAPNIPNNEILVSLVYVRGGSAEILSGDIFNDYKTVLTESIPDLEANTARVETAPSNSTDVVRQTELTSGNPHADSAGLSDLPRMEEYSDTTFISGPDTITYLSVSFPSDAYVHSYRLVADSNNGNESPGITSIIQTDNFSDSISIGFDNTTSKADVGKDFSTTSSLEFIAEAEDATANDDAGGGNISATATVLVFP